MRRPLLPLAAIGVMSLVTAACGGSSLGGGSGGDASGGGDGATTATIGLLVPQSGVYAPLGKDMENGFRLYLKEKGDKLGGKSVTVKVVDEGGGPDSGVPAGQGLAQDESVTAVVGVVNSAVALGLKDPFNEAQKPLIIANAGADAITGDQASDYVWRTSFANSESTEGMGKHVAEEVDGSVFLIGPDYAAGKEFLAGFQKGFEAGGGKIAGQTMTPFGKTTNFQPYLAQISSSGAKAVFAFYAGAEAVAFVKQYDELGLKAKTPLYATGFVTEGGALKAQGKAADGVQTALHYSSELDNATNQAFVKAYTDAYTDSPTVYSVQAYDAAAALDKALEKGVEGPQIVEGLKGIGEIDSPRGPWKFSDKHGPDQTYYLRVVTAKDGGYVNAVKGPLE